MGAQATGEQDSDAVACNIKRNKLQAAKLRTYISLPRMQEGLFAIAKRKAKQ
jgi:hypothetical protein